MKKKKVLLVDFDPQGNLTLCFGIEQPDKLNVSMFNIMNAVMEDEPLPAPDQYLHSQGNFDLIPGNPSCVQTNHILAGRPALPWPDDQLCLGQTARLDHTETAAARLI
ncbi:ParA family protein [Paenibacillus sp. PvR133]|uniref:ParA family protein n=1 Tax=Paenibacillus sp. PvR133 TaxID=2806598 RepID=UPI001FD8593E|nr:ParA family protein [Paenibacillus sp. PvR133]